MSDDEQIPEAAAARLDEAGTDGGNWSSDFSAAELAAVHHVGFDPVDFVMGSSIYHVGSRFGSRASATWAGGTSWTNSYQCNYGLGFGAAHRLGWNWEHLQYEEGVHEAYRLALGRLIEEAKRVNAHGVVGVRVRLNRMEGVGGTIEFTAFGTAIRRAGAPPLPEPFTSHLTGGQFAKLLKTGLVPTKLVYAVSAVEIDEGCVVDHQSQRWSTTEIEQLSDAVTWARRSAVEAIEKQSEGFGDRVIGVEVGFAIHDVGENQRIVQMSALGTVVHEFHDTPLPVPPLTIMRLS